MIPTALFLWTLSALCVIGVRHFRRVNNQIGFWGLLLVTAVVAGFAVFVTVIAIVFLTGPRLTF